MWKKSKGLNTFQMHCIYSICELSHFKGVSYLVGVCDYEGSLLREVVVEVGDDLDGHIGLSCTWRTHHLKEREGGGIEREREAVRESAQRRKRRRLVS